jgi:hypothetical protein
VLLVEFTAGINSYYNFRSSPGFVTLETERDLSR